MDKVAGLKETLTNPARRKEFVMKNRLNIIMYVCGFALILFVFHVFSDGDFSFLLTLGGLTRFFGFCFLLVQFLSEKSCQGVSLKTLELYMLVFIGRLASILMYEGYLPYDSSGDYIYQLIEVMSLVVVGVLVFFVLGPFKNSYSAQNDSFGKGFGVPNELGTVLLIAPALFLAILLHPSLNKNPFTDIAWTFALYLEAVAILPQFYMLQKSNQAVEPWVSHFCFAIGLARLFDTVFWASSYHELSDKHSLLITGGWVGRFVLLCQFIHIIIMAEFCYYYIKASYNQSPLLLPGLQV